MGEDSGAKNSNDERKDKKKKKQRDEKQKDEKHKARKTRHHFREEAQQARTEEVQEIPVAQPDAKKDEPVLPDSSTSLTPSAIVEMFHLQDDEKGFSSSMVTTARYLVENKTSGDFYQVRTKKHKRHAHLSELTGHRRSPFVKAQQKFRDGSTRAESWMNILQRDGEKAVVVMILGVVAGMCWMDAMNLHSRHGSLSGGKGDGFLCAYSAGSNRSRKNFFILFNGVLIGLTRKLSRMSSRKNYKALGGGAAADLTSYKLLRAASVLISMALLVLLIESPSALRLTQAQHTDAKWCEEVASTSTNFRSGVLFLQVCAILNTMLITTAWLLVALQCSVSMSSTEANRGRVVELQKAVSAHERRIDELQGTRLEGSSAEELKSLIQLHQRAIELTEGALVAKLQAQHRPTAAC